MARFTDTKGREFGIVVDLPLLRRVKKDVGIDFLDHEAFGSAWQRLGTDQAALVAVLWSLLEDDLRREEISEESFASGFGGEVFDSAATALAEAFADFFPPRIGALLRKTMARATEVTQRKIDAAAAIIEGPEVEHLMQAEVRGVAAKFREFAATCGAS